MNIFDSIDYLVNNADSCKFEAVKNCRIYFNAHTILPQTTLATCVQTEAFGNGLNKNILLFLFKSQGCKKGRK